MINSKSVWAVSLNLGIFSSEYKNSFWVYQWFRNSLENDKKPVSGSQVLDFKQLFDSLEENRRKKK